MFIVYRANETKTRTSYYGYCTGDSPKESFLIGAMRHNPERAAARRLFAIVDKDESRVQVEILEEHDNELDAWIGRNNYRATCSDAITGPSNWPSYMFERAQKEVPKTDEMWNERIKQRGAKTAREAWATGMWSNESIKDLSKTHPRQQVISDLDKLSPTEFDRKYFPVV